MSDHITVKISGLDELRAQLLQLPQAVQSKLVKGATAKACSVIRAEAVARAPVYTGDVGKGHPPPGTLKKAIYQARAAVKCTPTTEVWVVNVRQGKQARGTKRGKGTVNLDAFYARFVEFGHYTRAPESAGGTRAARRRAVAQGRQMVSGAHFVLPQPFMRPAFDTKQAEALQAFAAYLRDNLPVALQGLSYIKVKS